MAEGSPESPGKASRAQAASAAPCRRQEGLLTTDLSLVRSPHISRAVFWARPAQRDPSPPSQTGHSVSEVGQPGGG